MELLKLTDDMVDVFITRLKQGWTWSNGLVGHESFRFQDGQFIRECQDLREPEYGPYTSTYGESEFRTYLGKTSFVDFVHKRLVSELSAWRDRETRDA